MGAVSAQHEQELEAQLVGVLLLGIAREAILSAHLAELGGPIGQQSGEPAVSQVGLARAVGAIVPRADGPAPVEAILTGSIEAEGPLRLGQQQRRGELIAMAPDQFGAREEVMVDGAAQRLPAQGGVEAVELGVKGGADVVMPESVGEAEIHVGGLAQVAVAAQVSDIADVLPPGGGKDVGGIPAVNLRCPLEKNPLRRGENARDRQAGVVDTVFAA